MSTVRERGEKVRTLITRASNDAEPILKQIGMDPAAFARVAFNAVMTNPKILDCEPKSLRHAVLLCAQRGLLPDGESASIVPYKGKAGLLVGYKGMADLVRRAIPGTSIRTVSVNDKDDFTYEEGLNLVLTHVRDEKTITVEENLRAAYVVVEFKEGTKEIEVMFKSEIDRIRKTYSAANSPAWAKEYAEQAKKTVLRRICKRLPIRSGLLIKADLIVEDSGDPFDDQAIDVQGTVERDEQPPADKPKAETRKAAPRAAARRRPAPAPEPQQDPDPDPDPGDDPDDPANDREPEGGSYPDAGF